MRCEEFSTNGLPPHLQLEMWKAWYAGVFDTTADGPAGDAFSARNRAWNLGGLALNEVTAPALRVVRTRRHIRREPVDHWAITVSGKSATQLASGAATLDAPAGQPFILSLGEEMQNRRQADTRVQLYLSRDTFHGIAALLDAACMMPLSPAGGRLLSDYMQLLLRNLPDLGLEDASRLVDTTRCMLAACLAPSVDRMGSAQRVVNVTLMERVRQVVRRHLHSAELGPDLICLKAATSRSQLYRLLEGEGGVSRYVQKLRLSEAFSLLCKGPQTLTIATIAEKLCFADSSSFARAFRREFGISPSAVRDAVQAGQAPVPIAAADREIASTTFSDCLRAA